MVPEDTAEDEGWGLSGSGKTGPRRPVWETLIVVLLLLNSGTLVLFSFRLHAVQQTIKWVLSVESAFRANDDRYGQANVRSEPVTEVELYSDISCEICRFAAGDLLAARDSLSKAGIDVEWVYHPVASDPMRDPLGFESGLVTTCAIETGREWELFSASSQYVSWSREALNAAVANTALDREEVRRCVRSSQAKSSLWQSRFSAAARGIDGTPTVLVNGVKLEGQHGVNELIEFIRGNLSVGSSM